MAETAELQANKREGKGTNRARKLRKEGLLPAVVYGHKEETISIAVPHDDFTNALRHGVRLVELQMNGKKETALITDVQWDPFGQDILHADFTRVSRDEKIQVDVNIEIKGISPGTEAGGILEQPLHTLRIECPAMAAPDSIRVLVNDLQLGDAIHVKELKLPEGVVALLDPDEVVLRVVERAEEPDEDEAGEQAEPEIIGKDKEDAESSDDK